MSSLTQIARQLAADGMRVEGANRASLVLRHHDGLRTMNISGVISGSPEIPLANVLSSLVNVTRSVRGVSFEDFFTSKATPETKEERESAARNGIAPDAEEGYRAAYDDLQKVVREFQSFLGTQTFLALVEDAENDVDWSTAVTP